MWKGEILMKVTIYTTPNCVQCNQTKRVFTAENVPFDTVDLSEDAEAMEMVKGLGYTSAPVVIAGDSHWSGFRFERIQGVVKKIKSDEVHKSA
jgi:glutaredoxin-like protein NrdH